MAQYIHYINNNSYYAGRKLDLKISEQINHYFVQYNT